MWDNFYVLKATPVQTKCLICTFLVPGSDPASPEPLAEVLAGELFIFTLTIEVAIFFFVCLHLSTI